MGQKDDLFSDDFCRDETLSFVGHRFIREVLRPFRQYLPYALNQERNAITGKGGDRYNFNKSKKMLKPVYEGEDCMLPNKVDFIDQQNNGQSDIPEGVK
jgi:hypothetical protein